MTKAMEMDDSESWKLATNDEMATLKNNDTWGLPQLSKGRKLVGCKRVFKKKFNSDGIVEKYKVRLVVKGYY